MKFEIEITEEDIKNAIERKVRVAIADQSNQWASDRYIKDKVLAHWKDAVDNLIIECLSDSDVLKERIMKEVDAKLKRQITKMMKG